MNTDKIKVLKSFVPYAHVVLFCGILFLSSTLLSGGLDFSKTLFILKLLFIYFIIGVWIYREIYIPDIMIIFSLLLIISSSILQIFTSSCVSLSFESIVFLGYMILVSLISPQWTKKNDKEYFIMETLIIIYVVFFLVECVRLLYSANDMGGLIWELAAEGTLLNPNVLGGFIVLTCPLLIKSVIARRKTGLPTLRYMCAVLIGIILLLKTYSRSAWIAGISMVFFYFIIEHKTITRIYKKKWFIGLVTALLVIICYFLYSHINYIHLKIKSYFNPEYITNLQRIAAYKTGWRMFSDKPIAGLGAGTIGLNYTAYQTFFKWELHLHNLYAQLLVEWGMLGFIGWMVLICRGLFIAIKKNSLLATALTGFLIMNLFDYLIWIPAVALIFWYITNNENSSRPKQLSRTAVIIITFIFLAVYVFVQSPLESAVKYNMKGVREAENGHWKEADVLFEKAVSKQKNNPLYHYHRSVSAWKTGDENLSLKEINAARLCAPFDPALLNAEAWIHWFVKGDRKKTILNFKEAAGYDPYNTMAVHYLDMAWIDISNGKKYLDEAYKYYPYLTARAVRINSRWNTLYKEYYPLPDKIERFYSQDEIYGSIPQPFPDALPELSDVKKISMDNPLYYLPYMQLTQIYLKQNKLIDAEKNILKALWLKRWNPSVIALYAEVLQKEGEIKKAADWYKSALHAGKGSQYPHYGIYQNIYRRSVLTETPFRQYRFPKKFTSKTIKILKNKIKMIESR